MDKVVINMDKERSGNRLYTLSQEEANPIERRLQGGVNSDVNSEEDSDRNDVDDDASDGRITYRTRTGCSATRLIL